MQQDINMWTFNKEENGILFFTKGQMERNTYGNLSDVDALIAQWEAEDAAQTTQEGTV